MSRMHQGAARRTERGFTLIELMVSLVLFSVAVAGVLSVAVTMSSAFRDQRSLVQTETATRSPMDYLADVLRNASPGVQTGVITDGYAPAASAVCQNPKAIEVVDANVGTSPGPAAGTDTLDVIYASGAFFTYSHALWTPGTTLDVADPTGFANGDFVVLTDLTAGIVLHIQNVAGNTLTFFPPTCTTTVPGTGFANGSLLIRAMHAKFYVDALAVDGQPNLMMLVDPNNAPYTAGQPFADGVADLQVALGIDNNLADGAIGPEVPMVANADEWVYNATGEVQPNFPYALRSVRVTLIARNVNTNNSTNATPTFNRPAAENHLAAPINSDMFRRRILQSTVEIRNLEGSP